MTDIVPLIVQLTRIDALVRRDVIAGAAARRRRLMQDTLLKVRNDLLAHLSARAAAREIDDAVRGRRAGSPHMALRAAVVRLMTDELGYLDDVRGQGRIRQRIDG